jgi:hypothetical protein
MAKAQFHRNQRVWVDSVGAWAVVEKIVPVWAKGFGEPVRITYEVGLGREFLASELKAEDNAEDPSASAGRSWRLLRARNKWQQPEECGHHPYPGTFPIVVTDTQDWGGWRVPGAEYDRDPRAIETQARMIVSAPKLLKLARDLQEFIGEDPDSAPPELQALAKRAAEVLRYIVDLPAAAPEGDGQLPGEEDAA